MSSLVSIATRQRFMAVSTRREKPSGVITVFLSLVLILVVSLIFTCLEAARSEGLKLRARQIADSAIESVFAQYDRVLWENYGLLFFIDQGSEGHASELEDIMLEYAKKNAQGDGEIGLISKNWLKLHAVDACATNMSFATDQYGNIFRYSVYEYMKSAGLISVASRLFEMLEIDEDLLTSCDEAGELSMDDIASSIAKAKDELENPEQSDATIEETPEASSAIQESIWKDEAQTYFGDLISEFTNWRRSNILGLVVDDVDAISKRKLDDTELPSKTADRGNSTITITEEMPLQTLCVNEYIMQKTECYTSSQKDYLETEYIIVGKDNDRDNLYFIVKRLLGIRFAFDLAYYISSKDDGAMAQAIASAAAGWTGNAAIVEGVKYSILTIWAVRDSISEVRLLLKGEGVSLIRSTELGSKQGAALSYEDYLRILLLLSDSEEITYRLMDVIQRRVRISEPAFRFTSAVFAAEAELSLSGDPLFPFLPRELSYSIDEPTCYAYLTGFDFDE